MFYPVWLNLPGRADRLLPIVYLKHILDQSQDQCHNQNQDQAINKT